MIDPVTFALSFMVAFGFSIWLRSRKRRARRKARDFDGGFRHDSERRVTRIMSPYIHNARGDQ